MSVQIPTLINTFKQASKHLLL